MTGAYFSDQGTPIQQGAGSYFDRRPPVAEAFKSGVFGRGLDENYPGPLRSHQDGSLGSLGLPLFVNGNEIIEPVSIAHGARPATDGGTLGTGGGQSSVVSDGGTLGAGASQNGAAMPEQMPGSLIAYREGILGQPQYSRDMPGPLQAMYGGTVGAPPYAEAPRFTWPTAGLGAAPDPQVLDLSAPAVVKEMKAALAIATPAVAMTEEGLNYFTEDFYQSPYWGPKASELFAAWLDQFEETAAAAQQAASRSGLSVDVPGGLYPTPQGAITVAMMGVGSPGTPGNPEYFRSNFPALSAFVLAGVATEMDLSDFVVVPPFFSESERLRETKGVKMSTIALVGLGVVGALGAAVVIGTRRRKPRGG